MAFTGFNFRASAGAGTGFKSDPAGTVGVVAATPYPTSLSLVGGGTVTAGYKASASGPNQPAAVNTNNSVDGRLAGSHGITTTSVVWQVDVPNGTYDIEIAAAAAGSSAQQNARVIFGAGPNDFIEIVSTSSGASASVPNGSEMDATGSILADAAWAGTSPGQGTVRVTVKNGFLQITRAANPTSGTLNLRHFAFQVVPGTLQQVTFDTDDTGAKIDTTGTTTANSASVSLPSLPIGIAPGMTVTGLALPLGTTVVSVNGTVATTGNSTAGSTTISGIPSVANIYVGMAVTGPSLLATQLYTVTAITASNGLVTAVTLSTSSGVTTSAGGSFSFFGTGANVITLSSGAGVTASTGGALRFSWAPQIYEKEVVGKLIAPITLTNGAVNLSVVSADGSAPHPYLDVKLADPANTGFLTPFLFIKAAGFPGDSATHAFRIRQTDGSGNYSGSPLDTPCTLPVVFAPTKPASGFYSRISSGAWVMRELIRTKFLDGRWPGYKGQPILPGNSAVVGSLSALCSKMTEFAAVAGGGKWFSILLDPAGNWTDGYTLTSGAWDYKPEAGGGCIIANATLAPVIYGNLYTGPQRGVEWRGLTWAGNIAAGSVPASGNCFRMDYLSGKPLAVTVFRDMKFGALFDPSMTDSNLASKTGVFSGVPNGGVLAIKVLRGADQISIFNCDFFGTADAIQVTSVRILESGWNRFRRIYGDCHAVSMAEVPTPMSFTVPMTGAPVSDQEVLNYVHDNTSWQCMDNPGSYSTDLSNAIHPDFFQVRNAVTAGAQQGPSALLLEHNVSHSNATTYNVSGNQRYCFARQFLQGGNDQNTTPMRAVILNNTAASLQIRGLDLFGVVDGYAEYNTLAGAGVMPPSASGGSNPTKFVCVPQILSDLSLRRFPGRKRSRKNVMASGTFGAAQCAYTEDNALVPWDGTGTLPGTVFAGGNAAFQADESATTGRLAYAFPADALGSSGNAVRKATWALFKPLVDAGAQQINLRLNPGDSDTLTAAQAATLLAVTEAQQVGALPGVVSLRWNSSPGETGAPVGADVSLSVQ